MTAAEAAKAKAEEAMQMAVKAEEAAQQTATKAEDALQSAKADVEQLRHFRLQSKESNVTMEVGSGVAWVGEQIGGLAGAPGP